MARKPETIEFGDVKITATPLPYTKAEDILADVTDIVASVIQDVASSGAIDRLKEIKADKDVVKLLPIFAPTLQTLAGKLGEGKLKRLAPLVLASTVAIMPNVETGEPEKCHLVNAKERGTFFDEHPELYFACLFFAGKVTFGRFFSVRDLLAGKVAAEEG